MRKFVLVVFVLIVGLMSLRASLDTLSMPHALVFAIASATSFLFAVLLLGRSGSYRFRRSGSRKSSK